MMDTYVYFPLSTIYNENLNLRDRLFYWKSMNFLSEILRPNPSSYTLRRLLFFVMFLEEESRGYERSLFKE